MGNEEAAKDINNPEEFLFHADFSDESVFILPKNWEAVFIDCFGSNPKNYSIVTERLRLIVQKYKDHNAFPNKYDGLGVNDEGMGRYDDSNYYIGDPRVDNSKYAKYLTKEHTMAEIAKELLYVAIRPGLVQKTMQDVAESRGERPPLVTGTKQALEEPLSEDQSVQSRRLIMNTSPLLKHLAPYIN